MYKATSTMNVRQGNDITLLCSYTDDDNVPINLSNATITSEVRDNSRKLIREVTVNDIDLANGKFELFIKNIPYSISGLFFDIRISINDVITSTEVIKLIVSESVTHG